MLGVARVGDIGVGICCGHPPAPCIPMTGTLITGATNFLSESLPVSRIGDIMIGSCGHIGTMITGCDTFTIIGSGVCRIGDSFSGVFSGAVISGSTKFLVG